MIFPLNLRKELEQVQPLVKESLIYIAPRFLLSKGPKAYFKIFSEELQILKEKGFVYFASVDKCPQGLCLDTYTIYEFSYDHSEYSAAKEGKVYMLDSIPIAPDVEDLKDLTESSEELFIPAIQGDSLKELAEEIAKTSPLAIVESEESSVPLLTAKIIQKIVDDSLKEFEKNLLNKLKSIKLTFDE